MAGYAVHGWVQLDMAEGGWLEFIGTSWITCRLGIAGEYCLLAVANYCLEWLAGQELTSLYLDVLTWLTVHSCTSLAAGHG